MSLISIILFRVLVLWVCVELAIHVWQRRPINEFWLMHLVLFPVAHQIVELVTYMPAEIEHAPTTMQEMFLSKYNLVLDPLGMLRPRVQTPCTDSVFGWDWDEDELKRRKLDCEFYDQTRPGWQARLLLHVQHEKEIEKEMLGV